VQQFAVKIPINSDNFPIINFPVLPSAEHQQPVTAAGCDKDTNSLLWSIIILYQL
jgi:hypothetical protein